MGNYSSDNPVQGTDFSSFSPCDFSSLAFLIEGCFHSHRDPSLGLDAFMILTSQQIIGKNVEFLITSLKLSDTLELKEKCAYSEVILHREIPELMSNPEKD